MAIVRRRYYFWLIRAYVKRWSKTIISSLFFGVIIFFIGLFLTNLYILPVFQKKVQRIGYAGVYTTKNIPESVLGDVSYGLTRVNADNSISPAAAYRYTVRDNGREYIFYIKKGQYFDNKNELTSENLDLNFKDIKKEIIDQFTVKFTLKEPYSPFLSVVSKPIFSKDFSGLGTYKVTDIDLNGGFVKSITLQNKKDRQYKKIITFYPNQEALKTAYALGDINVAIGLNSLDIKDQNFSEWKNTNIKRGTNYSQLVSLFFDNSDPRLSEKKLRQALSYALPPSFSEGEKAYSPINPRSIYFSEEPNYIKGDLEIARSLMEDNEDARKEVFVITTPEEYVGLAEKISTAWLRIGVKTKIEVSSGLPGKFQILLYPMNLPRDPDQYTLWHSGQINNIVNYRNLRIDKLLEDGRSTADSEQRVSIYADFQKYLVDDVPAAFLYFPHEYTLTRK